MIDDKVISKDRVSALITELRNENTHQSMEIADILDNLAAVAFVERNVIRKISRGCSSCKHSRATRTARNDSEKTIGRSTINSVDTTNSRTVAICM